MNTFVIVLLARTDKSLKSGWQVWEDTRSLLVLYTWMQETDQETSPAPRKRIPDRRKIQPPARKKQQLMYCRRRRLHRPYAHARVITIFRLGEWKSEEEKKERRKEKLSISLSSSFLPKWLARGKHQLRFRRANVRIFLGVLGWLLESSKMPEKSSEQNECTFCLAVESEYQRQAGECAYMRMLSKELSM